MTFILAFKLFSKVTWRCLPLESSANVLFIIIFCKIVSSILINCEFRQQKQLVVRNFSLLHYLYLRVLSGLLIPPSSVFTPPSHYQFLGTSRSSLFSLLSSASVFFSSVSWQQLKDALMSFKSIVVVVVELFCLRLVVLKRGGGGKWESELRPSLARAGCSALESDYISIYCII